MEGEAGNGPSRRNLQGSTYIRELAQIFSTLGSAKKTYRNFLDCGFGSRDFVFWDFYFLLRNTLRFQALSCPFQDTRRSRNPILNCRTFVEIRPFQSS